MSNCQFYRRLLLHCKCPEPVDRSHIISRHSSSLIFLSLSSRHLLEGINGQEVVGTKTKSSNNPCFVLGTYFRAANTADTTDFLQSHNFLLTYRSDFSSITAFEFEFITYRLLSNCSIYYWAPFCNIH